MYQRQGQEVVGYFSGNLRGNVLQFRWQEPNNPPLTGEGYLVFDPQGRQYSGRWWSDKRDRVGDWNGWRQAVAAAASAAARSTAAAVQRLPAAAEPVRRSRPYGAARSRSSRSTRSSRSIRSSRSSTRSSRSRSSSRSSRTPQQQQPQQPPQQQPQQP